LFVGQLNRGKESRIKDSVHKLNSNICEPLMAKSKDIKVSFFTALIPILTLLLLIVGGLFLLPAFFDIQAFRLEFIFLLASVVACVQLKYLGFSWDEISKSIVKKIATAMPTLLILLAIGLIIGSWIACGTIPMLVYYGISMIHPDFIYVISFLVPVIFSTVTGTSWGSIATIGVVLMGVAISVGANVPITAAAVIGGSFFGDKLSPLSDTTNVAAMATDVPVLEHIKSMLYTTLPAALIAVVFYSIMSFVYPVSSVSANSELIATTLMETKKAFNFNLLLLLPPAIVLYGSIKKMPTLPVLVTSALTALLLAFVFQGFGTDMLLASLLTGFETDSLSFPVSDNVHDLFTRGGMYSFKEPIIISIIVFVFVGAIEKIKAMSIIVDRLFRFVKTKGGLVRSVLIATGITNSMTSNQYATSFVVGDAFKDKFDKANIKRNVLSRSLEDTGTMLESLVPWHQTAVFAATTLGVAVADYWYWQVFSLANILLAFIFTFVGFAIFKKDEPET
jgi:NhaC family Na+:H+ antiporter